MKVIRLYRWDSERSARDVRYWIELAVGVDEDGLIVAANEEEDVTYFNNEDDWEATLAPEGTDDSSFEGTDVEYENHSVMLLHRSP